MNLNSEYLYKTHLLKSEYHNAESERDIKRTCVSHSMRQRSFDSVIAGRHLDGNLA